MTLSLRTLLPLAGETLREPRATISRLAALDLPRTALWQALLLVVVLSTILAEITTMLMMAAIDMPADGPRVSALAFGGMQLAILMLTVFLIDGVGRFMGGKGRLEDAILAVAWLQFIMICVQIVQMAAILLIPALSGFVVMGGLVVFLWLLTAFTAEIHGFHSPARVFGMIIIVMMGVGFALAFLLMMAGVSVTA